MKEPRGTRKQTFPPELELASMGAPEEDQIFYSKIGGRLLLWMFCQSLPPGSLSIQGKSVSLVYMPITSTFGG